MKSDSANVGNMLLGRVLKLYLKCFCCLLSSFHKYICSGLQISKKSVVVGGCQNIFKYIPLYSLLLSYILIFVSELLLKGFLLLEVFEVCQNSALNISASS